MSTEAAGGSSEGQLVGDLTPVLAKVALDETKQTIAKAKGPSTLPEDLTTEASRRFPEDEDEDAERSWETNLAIFETERAKPATVADGPPIKPKDALPAAEAGGASTEAKDALPAPEAGGASTEVKAVKPAAEASCMPTFISHINATYQ